jgi:predicted ATPase
MRKTLEAAALAKQLNHPFTQAAVIGSSGLMFVFACDAENTIRYADEAIAVATEQSFAFWIALPKSMKGAAMCVLGRYTEAVQLLREGLSGVEATGAEIVHQMFLGWLARALWHTRDRTGAWDTLARAFEMTERDGERYFESELYCLKAEFLLADDPSTPQAVECLQKALTIAHHQGAKFFELRAALALGRLWRGAGRREDARSLVDEVVARFTEGFDTKDLANARAFLNELNPK